MIWWSWNSWTTNLCFRIWWSWKSESKEGLKSYSMEEKCVVTDCSPYPCHKKGYTHLSPQVIQFTCDYRLKKIFKNKKIMKNRWLFVFELDTRVFRHLTMFVTLCIRAETWRKTTFNDEQNDTKNSEEKSRFKKYFLMKKWGFAPIAS